jgi:hypothetical protein
MRWTDHPRHKASCPGAGLDAAANPAAPALFSRWVWGSTKPGMRVLPRGSHLGLRSRPGQDPGCAAHNHRAVAGQGDGPGVRQGLVHGEHSPVEIDDVRWPVAAHDGRQEDAGVHGLGFKPANPCRKWSIT